MVQNRVLVLELQSLVERYRIMDVEVRDFGSYVFAPSMYLQHGLPRVQTLIQQALNFGTT